MAEPIEPIPQASPAEKVVADELPTRFRCGFTPSPWHRFAGRSVLDVGAFDGFYSFLAEARGARRVVAVDNEQYVAWVRTRFGVTLPGGAVVRAIAGLLDSRVDYHRMNALHVRELGERFDVVLCFGILHRVSDPIALLQTLADVLTPRGEVVLETYGSRLPSATPAVEVHRPADVYPRDHYLYWGFPPRAYAGWAASSASMTSPSSTSPTSTATRASSPPRARQGPERAAALSLWLHALTWGWYLDTHPQEQTWTPRAWYRTKATPSFLDALAALRRVLWSQRITAMSRSEPDITQITQTLLDTLAYAA